MKQILLLMLVFSSCSDRFMLTRNIKQYELIKGELILGREVCYDKGFSFCQMDGHQQYRNSPYLIPIKNIKKDISNSYETVFTLDIDDETILDSSSISLKVFDKKNDIPYFDSLTNNNFNTLCIYAKNYKEFINADLKKKECPFNGYFCYQVFKVKYEAVYLGKKMIIYPNFKAKQGDISMVHKKVDLLYISKVISIKPVGVSIRQ